MEGREEIEGCVYRLDAQLARVKALRQQPGEAGEACRQGQAHEHGAAAECKTSGATGRASTKPAGVMSMFE
jgi:hypothetical protein